jgi:hypothetical protein
MSTQAPEKTKRIPLVSRYESHMIILRPAKDEYDSIGGRHTTDRGVMLRFSGYRYQATEEEFERLAELGCFTGDGEPKTVWVEDDTSPMMPTATVHTVQGAVAARPGGGAQPPADGWDTLPIATIRRLLADGTVDPMLAAGWERTHRNRARVRKAITDALIALDSEPVAELEPEPIDDVFGSEGGDE